MDFGIYRTTVALSEFKQITDNELTFPKINLETKSSAGGCLTIQCPKGLVISIPPGIDTSTLEVVMNSLWRLPSC